MAAQRHRRWTSGSRRAPANRRHRLRHRHRRRLIANRHYLATEPPPQNQLATEGPHEDSAGDPRSLEHAARVRQRRGEAGGVADRGIAELQLQRRGEEARGGAGPAAEGGGDGRGRRRQAPLTAHGHGDGPGAGGLALRVALAVLLGADAAVLVELQNQSDDGPPQQRDHLRYTRTIKAYVVLACPALCCTSDQPRSVLAPLSARLTTWLWKLNKASTATATHGTWVHRRYTVDKLVNCR